jgi:Potential Queuosine, Q, salvage protein family
MSPKHLVMQQAHIDYNPDIVQINNEVIASLDFTGFTTIELSDNEKEALASKDFKTSVAFLLGLNSINYQYWDLADGQFFRYSNNGKVGALAAFEGFENLFNDLNKDILNRLNSNSDKSKSLMNEYFGDIPSKESRIEILKESLNPENVDKAFAIIMNDIEHKQIDSNTAYKVAQVMPLSFNDPYLKKIQLALYEVVLHAQSIGYDVTQELTVAADYQLPKVMEALGILTYSQDLINDIDSYTLIEENSPKEKAIRAATIIACENISRIHGVSIPAIDRWLWLARNDYRDKKFHLTKTTAY